MAASQRLIAFPGVCIVGKFQSGCMFVIIAMFLGA